MKKTLGKPENWQDFESLCKKLWGEIWQCDEIKKNGRSGQEQHGVDVYGIPKNETEHYGIQCKGKDDYANSKLTESEIDKEIEKAKSFQPQLKKFYLATSANKDAKIETYVRLKDVENRKAGLFEVHLFCWEDIVDLIEENKRTSDWYIRNIDYKTAFSIKVTFHDGSEELNFNPKLVKNHIKYKVKPLDTDPLFGGRFSTGGTGFNREEHMEIWTEAQPIRYYFNGTSVNKSASVFSLRVSNDGNNQIENFKLSFEWVNDSCKLNTVSKRSRLADFHSYSYDTFIKNDIKKGVFEPEQKVLVQKDSIRSDDICIRPIVEHPTIIELRWKFVSKDFDKEGVLKIKLETEIVEKESEQQCDYPIQDEIVLTNYTESVG